MPEGVKHYCFIKATIATAIENEPNTIHVVPILVAPKLSLSCIPPQISIIPITIKAIDNITIVNIPTPPFRD